jgi:hypothetical protein
MSEPSEVEVWKQEPKGMMDFYQNQNYHLGQSLADLIDNSFDANARRIKIDIETSPEGGKMYIRILDDGSGMSMNELKDAMTLGSMKESRSSSDLGVYGIGMKISSLSQADEVTVVTRTKKGPVSLRRISAKHIRDKNMSEILKFSTGTEIYNDSEKEFIEGKWSTMVLLEEINSIDDFKTFADDLDDALLKELKKVEIHLGITFQRILEKRNDCVIEINGRKLKSIDPMMMWEDDPDFGTAHHSVRVPAEIEGRNVPVEVDFFIIPHTKRSIDRKRYKKSLSGYKQANAMQGLYIYRNNRLIDYGGWKGLNEKFTLEEHTKVGRIAIHIPADYTSSFNLSPTKIDVKLPNDFLERIKPEYLKERRWQDIKGGKEISFPRACKFRYDNEGKKADKRAAKRSRSIKSKTSTTQEISESTVLETPKGRKKASKPKPGVVLKINEEENETIIRLNNKKKGYKDLMEFIRMWKD